MKSSDKLRVSGGKCVFSVDVEDWFQAIPTMAGQNIAEWDTLPPRVQENFRAMLRIFARKNVRVTCFFLGWIAERFPELVKEAVDQGHEIASHGYSHRLAYQMTPAEFLDDVSKSKQIIESISGVRVLGYRAPAFSVTEETPWFFEKLAEAGYQFDSSVFPAPRRWGGLTASDRVPHVVETVHGKIFEFPMTVLSTIVGPVCFCGGGYLRLFPYALIKRMGRRVLQEGRPIIFYVHPREIDTDPNQPRLPMTPVGRFKSYVNLRTTAAKIERILEEFSITTFEQLIIEASAHQLSSTH